MMVTAGKVASMVGWPWRWKPNATESIKLNVINALNTTAEIFVTGEVRVDMVSSVE
jgi:hypothetical protein